METQIYDEHMKAWKPSDFGHSCTTCDPSKHGKNLKDDPITNVNTNIVLNEQSYLPCGQSSPSSPQKVSLGSSEHKSDIDSSVALNLTKMAGDNTNQDSHDIDSGVQKNLNVTLDSLSEIHLQTVEGAETKVRLCDSVCAAKCLNESNTDMIQCSNCKLWLHYFCTQLPAYQLYSLVSTARKYTCNTCVHVPEEFGEAVTLHSARYLPVDVTNTLSTSTSTQTLEPEQLGTSTTTSVDNNTQTIECIVMYADKNV